MADNRNKNQNQDMNQNKQGQVSQKPQRPVENEGNRQQSGNRQGGQKDLDKNVGNENRDIQKDLDTDETDEGQDLDEQGEITQRSPRVGEDQSKR